MPLHIIIVGTGIAGLGTAIALARKGHSITLLEAAAKLRPIGGMLVLQANAGRILDDFGVFDALRSLCRPLQNGPSTRTYTGEVLCTKPAAAHKKEYGYPLLALHRADLQRVLYEAAMQQGVNLRLNRMVVSVEEYDHTVAAVLAGGEKVNADLVVGADGIDSTVRQSIVDDAACVRVSELDITRATVRAADLESDPVISSFVDQMDLWCGPSMSIAAMAVRQGGEWMIGLDCCHRRIETSTNEKGQKQDIAEFRELFKDFAPSMQKLLSHVKEAHVWRLKETMPASWVSKSGKVVIIGDAAHGCLPWTGQGGGMALEDAVSLAECLDRATCQRKVPEVLRAFQEIRQPRCKQLQEWAACKGRQVTLPDGPEQKARDEKLRRTNAWVEAAPWDHIHVDELPKLGASNWKAWLSGHNAVEFAHRELDKRFLVERD